MSVVENFVLAQGRLGDAAGIFNAPFGHDGEDADSGKPQSARNFLVDAMLADFTCSLPR